MLPHSPCAHETPKVSIVLNTVNNADVIERCVTSLYQQISYDNFEVVVVEVGKLDAHVKDTLARLRERFSTFRTLHYDGVFNHARLANFAVEQLSSEYFFFITDDTRILTPDALQTMLGYFQDEQVGIVGPQKLYLDATIEHAGLVVGGEHVITPISRYMLSDWNGYLDRCAVSRNVSAVAGECMFISKEVFDRWVVSRKISRLLIPMLIFA